MPNPSHTMKNYTFIMIIIYVIFSAIYDTISIITQSRQREQIQQLQVTVDKQDKQLHSLVNPVMYLLDMFETATVVKLTDEKSLEEFKKLSFQK